MRMMRSMALCLAVLCIFSATTRAAFTIDIGDVVTLAGTNNVLVPIFVSTPIGNVSQFAPSGGFNLAIDIQPAGTGVAAGLTFVGVQSPNTGIFNSVTLNTGFNAGFGIDGIVNANGTAVPLVPGVPVVGANLVFNMGAAVPQGTTFAINFVPTIAGAPPGLLEVTDGTGTAYTLNGAGVNSYTLVNGSISTVPEPSSMLLAGGVAAVAGFRTWRKRRLTAKV